MNRFRLGVAVLVLVLLVSAPPFVSAKELRIVMITPPMAKVYPLEMPLTKGSWMRLGNFP